MFNVRLCRSRRASGPRRVQVLCPQVQIDGYPRVTAFFGLARIDQLWRPSHVELRLAPDRRNEANGTGQTQPSATLDKLSDLLATREHDYLYDVVDDLHRKEIQ